MTFLLTLFTFFIIIGFLIFFHELGHFLMAKKAGLLVEEFAIGFPPKVFSKKIGETKYSLNLIPFGGYVKIYGEEPDEESNKDERSFSSQKPFIKAKVLVAGVFANILLAVFIFYLVLLFTGFKWNVFLPFDYRFPFGREESSLIIADILEDSPAEFAGLRERETILFVDNDKIVTREDFIEYVNTHKEKEILLLLKDSQTKEKREVTVVPKEEDGNYFIGVLLADATQISYESFLGKAFSGFLHTANMTHLSLYSLFKIFSDSFTEKTVAPIRESTAGVVGIFAITHIMIKEGIIALLNMMGLISVGLAIMNILPIPALDGGRLVFVAYEAISRRKVPFNIEKNINFAGFAFIILLIITLTYNDIIRFGGIIKEMF